MNLVNNYGYMMQDMATSVKNKTIKKIVETDIQSFILVSLNEHKLRI